MNSFTPKLLGLDHVAIRVKDIDASIEWYKNTLGLIHILPNHDAFGKDPAMLCTKDYKQDIPMDENHPYHSTSTFGSQCIALVQSTNPRQSVPTISSNEMNSNDHHQCAGAFDHVAFRLSKEGYREASDYFVQKGLAVEEDHILQKSTYLCDLDNNVCIYSLLLHSILIISFIH